MAGNKSLQRRLDALMNYHRRRETICAVVDIRDLTPEAAAQVLAAKRSEMTEAGAEGVILVVDY